MPYCRGGSGSGATRKVFMHLSPIVNVVGVLLIVLGAAQAVPMGVAVYFGESDWFYLGVSGIISLGVGVLMAIFSKGAPEISERDGFFVVTLAWLFAAAVGALPYVLTGTIGSLTDAIFESMSGFTTTGATILTNFQGVGQGIFLWRSMTQWFGGMGIIVLALVILPALGIGGMQLFKREVPGPYSEKLTPRLRDTARALWSVYLGITVVEGVVFYLLGMTPMEAINHALTTVSTGGFSTRPDSIGGFQSPALEWAIIVFMVIGGINFSLHYRLFTHPRARVPHFRDNEFVWYLSAIILASLAVVAYLAAIKGYSPSAAATKGTFQVVSILTTSGFVSDDYVPWGAFPQILLVMLMIAGGCAGSTSGGIKWVRILLVFKYIYLELLRLIHPRLVVHAKLNHMNVSQDILSNIFAFIFLFLTTLGVVTLLISLDGHSFLTSMGAAVSALSNIGPGLDAVGPVENYAHLSSYAKWVLILAMLMGRLELMTVIVLFMPFTWRR